MIDPLIIVIMLILVILLIMMFLRILDLEKGIREVVRWNENTMTPAVAQRLKALLSGRV